MYSLQWSDSQFPYSCLVFLKFKISFLLTSINIPIRKFKISGNVISVLFYVFADVYFYLFGELKILYTKQFRMFEFRIGVAIWNTYNDRIFPWWLVQTCLLETSAFLFKFTVQSEF
jgi:hypothetical protein